MQIYVQSFLNSATKLPISVSTTTTISQLKSAISTAEGVSTAIMELYSSGVLLTNSKTVGFYNIADGDFIQTSNNIANLSTKEEKQVAKLELAQIKRRANNDTSKPYYRHFNTYDVDLLADKYVGNSTAGSSTALVAHRPWK